MIIYRSPLADVDIPDTTVTHHVLRRAAEVPDRPALIDGPSGRAYTYAQLAAMIASFAGGLAARGLGPGDTIALMSPNIPEYAVAFHGAAVAGVAVSTVNPTYTADEVRFQLQDSGALLLVTVALFVDTAREAIAGTDVTDIVVIGEAPEGTLPVTALFGAPLEQVPVDLDDHVVVLPYSSGTTGLPKGVMLTHRNLVANLCQIEGGLAVEDDEVALAVLPFFHIYGMQVLMNGLLAQGVTIITVPRFDLEQVLGLIQDQRVTRFFAVPPIVLALAKHPLVDSYDLSSLRQIFSGAAPLSAELALEAGARVGCEVVQGYGMTEMSPVSHLTPPGQFKAGTCGVTVPNAECRIVDPVTGADQPVDGEGELWVRGPMVMKGYLNNPEATALTVDADGWLHTGDIGAIDADGHMTIVDRVKELIKVKGFQVAPAELEALLLTHPSIADAAVIGIPDEESGEVPRAFIVVKPHQSLTADEVTDFTRQHVATYKVVHDVVFTEAIPKSASGKILRRMLRDQGS
ncbi:MAG: 4-coumarate--CoA ligase family protein [Candidatus Nanopelagicales bacterium]|jgi:acyl-CoA synthetase (AMP-forming)/AMP-acid ligase II|nr:4-coumarate--CoA ligase family protein [Candidatus Nanopelagicales bacterium]MDP4715315.1 4-coumarate--CoA ligase family protein [Candidatus Nanopelagicales bacterium]MDP4907297.1 4-coumarate--CoA ligase family protein [Candidatus Nanopelagicales bacterium]MDP4975975.1 4-coumarate--CoA ligase family protein [Candidatus Nanopelagicales bacterium]MDP5095728.1 4-coumarate--CoA ligase family protein [Candidatus Nanopelagicales bacterium]